jgi:cobalamin biosynthesis Mg chelatase CobN
VTVDGAPAPREDVSGLQPAQTTAGAVAATDAQGQTPVVEPVASGERTTVSAVSGAARQTNAQKVESTAQPMLRLFAIGLTLFGLMLLVSVGGVAWLRRRSR